MTRSVLADTTARDQYGTEPTGGLMNRRRLGHAEVPHPACDRTSALHFQVSVRWDRWSGRLFAVDWKRRSHDLLTPLTYYSAVIFFHLQQETERSVQWQMLADTDGARPTVLQGAEMVHAERPS